MTLMGVGWRTWILDVLPMTRLKQRSIPWDPCFHDEAAALRVMERAAWPFGPECPHCKTRGRVSSVTGRGARVGLRFCLVCRKQFRVTIRTILDRSHIPAHKWLLACKLMIEGKISAHELHLVLGVTYKSAIRMRKLLISKLGELPRTDFEAALAKIMEAPTGDELFLMNDYLPI